MSERQCACGCPRGYNNSMLGIYVFALVVNVTVWIVWGKEVSLWSVAIGVCVIGAVLFDRAVNRRCNGNQPD